MTPSLGAIAIDLQQLLLTRMLIQSNSGGGKSHALRRVLEQTAPLVQQLVIDPEGEFSTLRERFDYIICAPSGADTVATPKTAAALARALWRSGSSAVLDIYELPTHDRILFVRRFLEALIAAPKSDWHSTIVVIDEAHHFCPQVGSAESSAAVADLASKGRKRGLSLLAATQRIAKFHKDVAAELLNKAIGRTGLDVDVRRAADELGMTNYREALETLRNLEPGEFFTFGPALTRSVERTRIGPVTTTHPEIGQRALVAPPPASAKVKAQLAKIEGLQRDAEQETKSLAEAKAENVALRREVAEANRKLMAAPAAAIPAGEVERRVSAGIKNAMALLPAPAPGRLSGKTLRAVASAIAALQAVEMNSGAPTAEGAGYAPTRVQTETKAPVYAANTRPHAAKPAPRETGSVSGLRAGAVRILQELAARSPAGYTLAQVGGLTQFSVKGGTFRTYLGDLRRGGFIEERGNLVFASVHGITSLGDKVPSAPTSHSEAMALWRKALRSGAHAMLEAIVQTGADGITPERLAMAVDMQASGGTFRTYLGDLRRNGLIASSDGVLVANDILFPERT